VNEPDWSDHSHCIALTAAVRWQGILVHLMFNAHWDAQEFELPRSHDGVENIQWHCWIDTAVQSPQDIVPWQTAPRVTSPTYRVDGRSVAVLFAWA
jgi:glycogen operon protein